MAGMRRAWLWLLERATRWLGRFFVRRKSADDAGKNASRRNDVYPMW